MTVAGIAKLSTILLRFKLASIQGQFTTPQTDKSVATDSRTTSNIDNNHMMMGLETLGAGPVNVVGVGGEELVLLSLVVELVGSDAFA